MIKAAIVLVYSGHMAAMTGFFMIFGALIDFGLRPSFVSIAAFGLLKADWERL